MNGDLEQELADVEVHAWCQPCSARLDTEYLAETRQRFPGEQDEKSLRYLGDIEERVKSRTLHVVWMRNGAQSGRVRCRHCHGWIEVEPEAVEFCREEDVRLYGWPRYQNKTTYELHA